MKALSLFAGAGGFDLAAEAADIDVLATAEIDKHAHALLKKKWPERHHYTDVKDITRASLLRDTGALPRLVLAGFPCQGLSIAGAGAGLADARSGLFWEIIRIARECESEWLLLENVPGLLTPKHYRDMGIILGALSHSGYGWAYRCLDAQYFGVAQRRRRVFFVARLGDDGRASAEVLALAEGRSGDPAPSRPTGQDPAEALGHGTHGTREVASALTSSGRFGIDGNAAQGGQLVVCVTGDIAHTLTSEGADASEDGTGRGSPIVATYRKSKRAQTDQDDETWVEDNKTNTLNLFDIGDARATSLIVETDVRRLTPVEWERLQGFPDGWTAGQADSHRYKQMGNAVAVPCVSWILQRLVLADALAVGSPRHDAVSDQLLQSVPQVGAEVAVPLLPGDLSSSNPEVIGDADVA